MLSHELIQNVRDLILRAGDIALSACLEDSDYDDKDDGSLVTKFDKEISDLFNSELIQIFPESGILDEETWHFGDEHFRSSLFAHEYLWIIDPIDGTNNFYLGSYDFCISISLVKLTDTGMEPVFAMVYAPILHEIYYTDHMGNAVREKVDGMRCKKASGNDAGIERHERARKVFIPVSAMERLDFDVIKSEKLRVCCSDSTIFDSVTVALGIASGCLTGARVWDQMAAFTLARANGLQVYDLNGNPISEFSFDMYERTGNPSTEWRLKDRYVIIAYPKMMERLVKCLKA